MLKLKDIDRIKLFIRDRIEITNPGGLPRGLSKKAFGTISVRRNEIISDLFFRLHKVERIGMGIQRMREAVADTGLKEPDFDTNGFFRVIFYREVKTEGNAPPITPPITPLITPLIHLTDLEKKILQKISENPQISGSKLSNALEISISTIKEYLNKLKKKGVLRRIGKARNGYWEVVK
ncbi:MAG: winged helix-turn-helix transcriptional regulator [Deltaproteobacteria bacterium]|nr:winged helix-turn-helix transcriptional regulator [Deltaproteobacteria bacterium]